MNQSATLYAHYYLLQICIHRPFIPSPRKPSRLTFPSLAICTNAARSCAHVLDVQMKKTDTPFLIKLLNRVSRQAVRKVHISDTTADATLHCLPRIDAQHVGR